MRQQRLVLAVLCAAVAVGVWFTFRPPETGPRDVETSHHGVSKPEQLSIAPAAQDAMIAPPAAQPSVSSGISLPPNPGGGTSAGADLPGTSAPTSAAINVRPLMQEPVRDEETVEAIDEVHLMLRDYRTIAGENPVGTNAEIMKSVMGGNPKQATLGPPEGQSLNADGELIDRWGTPYFFHQISGKEMQVRSAGADRKMWTDDDIQQ